MTFGEVFFPTQKLIRGTKNFGEWSLKNQHLLFPPYRDPNYSLVDIIHVFMNRLNQNYQDIMLMDQEKRDTLANKEIEIMKNENKQ